MKTQTCLWYDGNGLEAVEFHMSLLPDSQDDADRPWDALADGGKPIRCGWITDRFGLGSQFVPRDTRRILFGADGEGAKRAHDALKGMIRIDTAALQAAHDGV